MERKIWKTRENLNHAETNGIRKVSFQLTSPSGPTSAEEDFYLRLCYRDSLMRGVQKLQKPRMKRVQPQIFVKAKTRFWTTRGTCARISRAWMISRRYRGASIWDWNKCSEIKNARFTPWSVSLFSFREVSLTPQLIDLMNVMLSPEQSRGGDQQRRIKSDESRASPRREKRMRNGTHENRLEGGKKDGSRRKDRYSWQDKQSRLIPATRKGGKP